MFNNLGELIHQLSAFVILVNVLVSESNHVLKIFLAVAHVLLRFTRCFVGNVNGMSIKS